MELLKAESGIKSNRKAEKVLNKTNEKKTTTAFHERKGRKQALLTPLDLIS